MGLIVGGLFDDFQDNLTLIQKHSFNYCFNGVQGSFPFSIFNGDVNTIHKGCVCLYRDIIECLRGYHASSQMVLLDFGNLRLEQKDYHNNFGKVQFETFANDNRVFFQIADLGLIEYATNKYPNIQIVLHQNYTFFHNAEEVQDVLKQFPNIKGIVTTHGHLFENIDTTKFYLLNFYNCGSCKSYKNCILFDNLKCLEYSGESNFFECSRKQLLSSELALEYLKESLEKADHTILGIPKVDNVIHFEYLDKLLEVNSND